MSTQDFAVLHVLLENSGSLFWHGFGLDVCLFEKLCDLFISRLFGGVGQRIHDGEEGNLTLTRKLRAPELCVLLFNRGVVLDDLVDVVADVRVALLQSLLAVRNEFVD